MAAKRKIIWKEVEKACAKIVNAILDEGKEIESVFGIPRGGLVVAVMISHLLRKPLIQHAESIDEKTLVVDDICDSGSTFENLMDELYQGRTIEPLTAALYTRSTSKYMPFCTGELIMDDSWLIFPWETAGSSKYDHTYGKSE